MSLLKARSHCSLLALLAASMLLGACGDATAPESLTPQRSQMASPAYMPSPAAKALVGVTDGTYEYVVDPRKENKLYFGSNALFIPPKAICDLQTSSYGASQWDAPCDLETSRFTITATVRNANSSHPSIDFQPALRFNPAKTVMLYFYVPNGSQASTKEFVVEYCTESRICVDESLLDASLATYFNAEYEVVYRRIKHFSGYIVAGREGEGEEQQMNGY